MTCNECRRLLHDWLDATLADDRRPTRVPAEIARHAESCSDCRARVESAMIVAGLRSSPVPPPELAERVKARLRDHLEARDRDRFAASVDSHRVDEPTAPARPDPPRARSPMLPLVARAAIVAVAVFAGIVIGRSLPFDAGGSSEAPVAAARQTSTNESTAEAGPRLVRVEFRLEAPTASHVAVVGDWNGWDAESNPLRDPDGDGVWETTITLHPDVEYQYQFLVDEETWIPDPSSPLKVDDGFGGTNSVLNI